MFAILCLAVIFGRSGNEIFRCSAGEPQLDVDPPFNMSGVVPPFGAYSHSGVVERDLVYVNYARTEDFDKLKREGISVKGKIAIARYGKGARGRKLRRAQDRGAVGMIVYSDPKEVVGTGSGSDRMYPYGWFAPGTAVQRGHFLYGVGEGEPLTPGYPATDYAYRIDQSDSDQLPTIPVHVIGYNDAKELLRHIGGDLVPSSWKGLLDIDYRFGPEMEGPASKVRLDVNVQTEVRTIHNVVGIIRGRQEPDRYVILGNHRDAWTFGAVDPNSGTACLLEISRALGEMLRRGWRPRRTLMFVSWDAEEHGMHGSYEWIEEFGKIMSDRAVAYLNVDNAVRDDYTLRARATPSLKPLLKEAAKMVPWPTPDDGDTLYEVWSKRSPETSASDSPPKIDLPAGASDYVPFVKRIGVPILDIAMVHRYTITYPNFPLYHTAYETFHLQKTYIDPEFKFHRLMSQLWGELALSLAESWLLPIDASEYAGTVQGMYGWLVDEYGTKFEESAISLDALQSAVANFSQAAVMFEDELSSLENNTDPLVARMYNDQLMQMEQAFINPQGILYQKFSRHTILSSGLWNTETFPALGDAVRRMGSDWTDPGKEDKLKELKQELSIITFFIQSAANSLAKPASPNGDLTEEFGGESWLPQTRQVGCSSGYQMHNGICYKAFNTPKNFHDASSACATDGGTLAMPKDASTNDFLLSLKNAVDESGFFWFGLVDHHQEGGWEWVDGTPIGSFNAWEPGEPNNAGDEDCAEYFPTAWNDAQCSEADRKFICQKIPTGCPGGYVYHQPSRLCYKAFNEKTTYSGAVAKCSADGGTLAIPRSPIINKFLIYLKNAVDTTAWFRFGLTDHHHQEGDWIWDDYVALGNFSSWGPEDNCAEYFPGSHSTKDTWNDGPCASADRKFICQVYPLGCPPGYQQHGHNCYKANNDKKSYDNAAATCRADGGSLAMPRDLQTHEFLVTLKNQVDRSAWFWLGFNDQSQEGEWYYVDGTRLGSFQPWYPNEPNNHGGNEDCGVMFQDEENNEWNDHGCSSELKFICQISLQGHVVRLTFLDFDLENSEFDLEFDHVTVVDGSIDKQLGKFSGTNLPPAVTSSGRTMEVIFTTDQSVTERGFKAQYRGVNGYLTSVGESRIEVTLWRQIAAAQTLATVPQNNCGTNITAWKSDTYMTFCCSS
ncbi:hypothetical protein Bbelb_255430 [Branchiostoma belcheri]|nr:hypothetical protein Bbelb_255430 [Branchiostoma belcheri]